MANKRNPQTVSETLDELARRVGLRLELIPYDAAAKITGSALDNVWDVAFLAIDPGAIPLPEPPRAVSGTPFDFRTATPIGAVSRTASKRTRASTSRRARSSAAR